MIRRFVFKDKEIYALYNDEDVPRFVGNIFCNEARDLILQAPALEQLRRKNKLLDSKQKRELAVRKYKEKTADYIEGMARWLKKL
jgi:hypothetical protein